MSGSGVKQATYFVWAVAWLLQFAPSCAFAQGISLSGTPLTFSAFAGGDAPAPQSFGVTSVGNQAVAYSVTVTGAPWLSVRPANGLTPARIQVSVDQTALGVGSYSANLVVSSPGAPDLALPVAFTVDSSGAVLDVSPSFGRLEAPAGSGDPLQQALFIRNAGGGGPMNFQAAVTSDSDWLTVTPPQGQAAPNGPAAISAMVDPTGLATGVYRGVVHVDSDGGSADIPISLVVGTPGPALGLNFTGLLFQARQGNGDSNTRNVLVLNNGTGTSNWQTELLSGGEWLSLSAASARGQATPENASRLALTANPGTLDPGVYYSLIRISDPQAINSPIYFTAVLQVLDAGAAPFPDPTPQGLFFVGQAGAPPPATQPFRVFVSSNTPVPFQASVSTQDGANWLSLDQSSGVTSTNNTAVLNVTADPSKLDPGIYHGDVTVALLNQVIRTTNITIVVPNTGVAASANKRLAGCAPSRMSLTQTGLVNSFDAPVGWPETLIVRLSDDCGGPVLDAQMVSTFSNGDPPLAMALSNPQVGLYSATWSPKSAAAQVRVTAQAIHATLGTAATDIIGGVSANQAPILFANGTLANANPVPGAPLAPGSIAQVNGLYLAASDRDAPGSPLPPDLNGTTVLIGAEQAPIFSVSSGSVKIQIPWDLAPGREHSVIVSANGAYTIPDTIALAPAQPGISTDGNGEAIAQGADSTLISEAAPAHAGDTITILVEGMGSITSPIDSGTSASQQDPVQIQPDVTIDGETAQVSYAGLAPGLIGLYQISLQIPSDLPPGDHAIVVTQNGAASNPAILPVR